MRVEMNGVGLLELATPNRPYKLWNSDMFKCPVCGFEVLTGYSSHATHNFDEKFMKQIEHFRKHTRLVLDYEKISDAINEYSPDFSNMT